MDQEVPWELWSHWGSKLHNNHLGVTVPTEPKAWTLPCLEWPAREARAGRALRKRNPSLSVVRQGTRAVYICTELVMIKDNMCSYGIVAHTDVTLVTVHATYRAFFLQSPLVCWI